LTVLETLQWAIDTNSSLDKAFNELISLTIHCSHLLILIRFLGHSNLINLYDNCHILYHKNQRILH
jgi:hypothetical protein